MLPAGGRGFTGPALGRSIGPVRVALWATVVSLVISGVWSADDADPVKPKEPPRKAPGMPRFNSNDVQVFVSKFTGDSTILRCTVDNKGIYDVAWIRQTPHAGIIFSKDGMYNKDPRYSIETDNNRTYNLRINNLRRSDQGVYSCTVNLFPTMAWNVTLQIVAPATVREIVQVPRIQDGRRYKFVYNESDSVELKCVGDGSPEPELEWFRLTPSGDLEQVGNGTLRIPSIQRNQAGEYRCEANNGLETPDYRIVTIKVNYIPDVWVENGESEIRKAEDEYVQMQCRVDAYPKATYAWTKDGVVIPLSRNIISRSWQTVLVIVGIKPEHYGLYSCQATNFLGTSEAYINLNGKPLPPIITSDPVGNRRHIYKLSWTQNDRQPPNAPGTIPVTFYKILYRGWWRQPTKNRQRVYSLEDENNLLEELAYPDSYKVQQYGNLIDLRHNATYELQLYAVNDQGGSDPVNFTFYTALLDEMTTSNGDATVEIGNNQPESEEREWRRNSSPRTATLSTVAIVSVVIPLALIRLFTEIYR